MSGPLLYDAVTLRHFGVCQQLAVCALLHASLPAPRWTEAVRDEIRSAARAGQPGCKDVLAEAWLGAPTAPATSDQLHITRLRIALGGGHKPSSGHGGEAESIFFAGHLGARFATDDNAAFDFAERRLGVGRVIDTVDILRAAVAEGHVTSTEALGVANAVRASRRFLRRVHPSILTEAYFR